MRSKTTMFIMPAITPSASASQEKRRADSRAYQSRKRDSNPSSSTSPCCSAVHARRSAARAAASAASAILMTGAVMSSARGQGADERGQERLVRVPGVGGEHQPPELQGHRAVERRPDLLPDLD